MKAFIKKFIATISASALLMVPQAALVTTSAHAQANDDIRGSICEGVTLDPNATASSCDNEDGQNNFNTLAARIINIFSIVVGAISVIMIIIGGFRYIISGGDSNGVTGAKNTILYAIVGLVIVLFAQVIVRFVLTNTSTNA